MTPPSTKLLRASALATIPLNVSLVTVGLWIQSYSRSLDISWHHFTTNPDGLRELYLHVHSLRGGFDLCYAQLQFGDASLQATTNEHPRFIAWSRSTQCIDSNCTDPIPSSYHLPPSFPSYFGFQFEVRPGETIGFLMRKYVVAIPYWSVSAILAGLTVCAMLCVRKGRRLPKYGTCARCDYDLRATPERCPECGNDMIPCDNR